MEVPCVLLLLLCLSRFLRIFKTVITWSFLKLRSSLNTISDTSGSYLSVGSLRFPFLISDVPEKWISVNVFRQISCIFSFYIRLQTAISGSFLKHRSSFICLKRCPCSVDYDGTLRFPFWISDVPEKWISLHLFFCHFLHFPAFLWTQSLCSRVLTHNKITWGLK